MSRRWRFPRGRRLVMAVMVAALFLIGPAAGSALGAKPGNTFPPEVVGETRLGAEIVCGPGSWTGSPGTFEYEWVRDGITVSARGLYPHDVYFLKQADEGHQVWCITYATNGEGTTSAESWNSLFWGKPPPEEVSPKNVSPPQLSGEPAVGKVLTCSQGNWEGSEPLTYAYQWLRNKEGIVSAAASTYTVTGEDEGKSLSCRVTAKNNAGTAPAESTSVLVPVGAKKPQNEKAPEVLGIAAVNEVLTCNEGKWGGTKPQTYKFKWLRDGTTALGVASIYTIEAADEGHKLSCEVVAENNGGKATAFSTQVTVSVHPPQDLELPKLTPALPTVGATITCSPGTWTGSPEFEFQWLRDGVAVGGQVSQKYTVLSTDGGHALACQVTATNSGGKGFASSAESVVPESNGLKMPKNVQLPAISGSAEPGHELTCSKGVWSESPTRYTYQWWRDPKKAGAIPLELKTSSTYKVVSEDEGHTLSCRVTAINGEGSAEAESLPASVAGSKPKPQVPPEVSPTAGKPQVGDVLTCVRGTWQGAPAPEFSYRWLRDKVTNIGTGSSYVVVSVDRGHSISCTVTASNSEGETEAESSNSRNVGGSPPIDVEVPAIIGTPDLGNPLTCSEGKWSGTPTPTYSYQWLLNNVAIPSATGSTYTVRSSDRGLRLTCEVTAKNSEGSSTASSQTLHIPGIQPKNLEAPFISGVAVPGQTLTCGPGIWEGKPPPVFAYQWLRDQTPIGSATASTYNVERSDQGHRITCDVTAKNSEGSSEAESSNGAAITLGGTTHTGGGGSGGGSGAPTAAQILDALGKQMVKALGNLRIRSVVKSGGNVFSFIAPAVGTLEIQWYVNVRGAHKKVTRLIIAEAKVSYAKALSKGTVRVRLTAKGRKAIAHRKQYKVTAKAVFSVTHGVSVRWLEPILLRH